VDGTSRREADPLSSRLALVERALREEPWSFEFFQAVRLLSLLEYEREPIGEFSPPYKETVRIGVHATLGFPPSEIASLDWENGTQPLVRVNFMGLVGPLGVLPTAYTEFILERQRARDHGPLAFLDVFHHRLASLFYKAWEKTHFPVLYERQGHDPLAEMLYALLGFGTPGLRNRQSVPDEAFLFYGGLFAMATRPAAALEAVLADYFEVPVSIEQFVGVWRQLDESDCSYLATGSLESYQLGVGAVVGDEVWDQQSRARIRIGPLPVERYEEFLPEGSAFEPLRSLVRAFYGDEMEFEVQLILERQDVPVCDLGEAQRGGPRLGWLTWLKTEKPFGRDPADTLLLV
jgi:type VI secretion system protein ImpH